MAFYEHVFIARQDLSPTQVETLTEDFKKIITDNGGKIAKHESWGLKTLAYQIKKNKKGHYVFFNLDTPSDAIKELERIQRINADILRFITIKVDELEKEPSIQLKEKNTPYNNRTKR